jgi:hypothetical protein
MPVNETHQRAKLSIADPSEGARAGVALRNGLRDHRVGRQEGIRAE